MVSKLRLAVKPERISLFCSLLQRGFIVELSSGLNLQDLLLGVGFPAKYLEERVQTIFLNGSAVDNPESEILVDGAVIALSAALPGLVGAIFRKDVILANLRTPTLKRVEAEQTRSRLGHARIKLFNLVSDEMGPELLRAGVTLIPSEIEETLVAKRPLLESVITGAELDGKVIDADVLFSGNLTSSEFIFLSLV